MTQLRDFTPKGIDGAPHSLSSYANQVCLIVNVASKCGLTPHYKGLQALYEKYKDRGFSVLGFPCNQFAGQEPGTEAEIQQFCEARYGVSFPLFSKIEVNGPGQDPLFTWLTSIDAAPEGAGAIKWNFGKFLVGRDGALLARFGPRTEPEAPELVQAIESALAD